jgi:hypothetical protein
MDDLLKLPCWARVAFAARCARRVQPLFNAWKGATQAYKDAVDKAITLSEASARAGRAEGSVRDDAAADTEAAAVLLNDPDAFYDAANSDATTLGDGDLVSAASEAAAAVAYGTGVYDAVAGAASNAAAAAGTAEAAAVSAAAYLDDFADGAAEAAVAAAEFASSAGDDAEAAIWSDYDRLLALATAEAWDDATPVDVNRLGPI